MYIEILVLGVDLFGSHLSAHFDVHTSILYNNMHTRPISYNKPDV